MSDKKTPDDKPAPHQASGTPPATSKRPDPPADWGVRKHRFDFVVGLSIGRGAAKKKAARKKAAKKKKG